MKVAKRDLVPTEANLLDAYADFPALTAACDSFAEKVNARARVEEALGMAVIAGRFGEGDLMSILDHIETGRGGLELIRADEAHSVQPGTGSWEGFGR